MKRKLLILLPLFSIFCSLFLSLLSSPVLATERQDCVDDMGSAISDNLCKFSNEGVQSDIISWGIAVTGGSTSDNEFITRGAIPSIGNGIAFMASRPPVMAGEYIADVLYNSGFIAQPAYAQEGLGFASLTPVLQIWKAFRNIAYFMFILVFIVIGFMIMFRAQVDHQTVVTVQMALPKMIITLILITFSYAIAGLVVDLLYLSIFVIIAAFHQFGLITNPVLTQNAILGRSILRIGVTYFMGAGEAAGGAANAISAIIQGIAGLPGGIIDWILDGLAYLIVAVAMAIAFFRTFFALLQAYIGIILATIFAPIQLLFNAIPGQNTFSSWLKGLIANAAIFPAIAVMIIIGIYFVGKDSSPSSGINVGLNESFGRGESSGFVPPFVTSRGEILRPNTDEEEFGVDHIRAIIGLGFVMLLPEVAKIVKGALGVEDKMGLGEMALANLQKGTAPVNKVLGAPFRLVGGIGQAAGQYAVNYAGVEVFNRATEKVPALQKFFSKRHRNSPSPDEIISTQTIAEDAEAGEATAQK